MKWGIVIGMCMVLATSNCAMELEESALDVKQEALSKKVRLCHIPDDGGEPHAIVVNRSAARAHLAHGDFEINKVWGFGEESASAAVIDALALCNSTLENEYDMDCGSKTCCELVGDPVGPDNGGYFAVAAKPICGR